MRGATETFLYTAAACHALRCVNLQGIGQKTGSDRYLGLQLKDDREENLNVDGFAVDVAGFPVGGGGNDADGFGVQFGAYALDDLDVPEFSVGADVELNQEASFDAGFCGGLRVTEFLRNPLGEIIDVATLEGGLVLGSRERNDLY